jgi:ectoine hydroxylase-related dioxygenase (phytanoyl-CoA dioxygenase family)
MPVNSVSQGMIVQDFEHDGFIVTAPLLTDTACMDIESALTQIRNKGVGSRNLLEFAWCKELAQFLREHAAVNRFLPPDGVAVQCTYFEKSCEQNWLVPVHQDLSIPVAEKVDHPALPIWSEKEGSLFVQAPDGILQSLMAARLHIDECGAEDGPLRVVPGSHRAGRLGNEQALRARDEFGETICTVAKGAALLMKPLLLHASSKSSGRSRRRVLHFVFGPKTLPHGLKWAFAAQ